MMKFTSEETVGLVESYQKLFALRSAVVAPSSNSTQEPSNAPTSVAAPPTAKPRPTALLPGLPHKGRDMANVVMGALGQRTAANDAETVRSRPV